MHDSKTAWALIKATGEIYIVCMEKATAEHMAAYLDGTHTIEKVTVTKTP